MPSIWPTTKVDGDEVPADEWNGIVDFGVQKTTAPAWNVGPLLVANGTNKIKVDNLFVFDTANDRLGIGTSAPASTLHLKKSDRPAIEFESGSGDTNQKRATILYDGRDATLTGGGFIWQRLTDGGAFSANLMALTSAAGLLGLQTLEPETLLHLASVDNVITLDETSNTPANPTADVSGRIYFRGDKIIFQWNDGGTVRYKYLLMTGTGVTWVHTTSAP